MSTGSSYTLEPIGFLRTCFPEKFGIPRQPLLAPSAKGRLVLLPPYNSPDFIDGLDKASHLWVSFIFHQHLATGWKSKVRPPRLGGNKKTGVFATRSSFRPNHLGLSVVKLERIEITDGETVLHLSGVDMLDRTPVVDIKPYLQYADSIPDATHQLAINSPPTVSVGFSDTAEQFCRTYGKENNLKQLITEVLQQDPRPAYQNASKRCYKMALLDVDIEWEYIADDIEPCIQVVAIQAKNSN